MKKTVSVLLSFVMIISILTALPFTAQALPAKGKCGDNAFYKFDSSSGTLTISGKGGDVYYNSFYNESKIKKVVINNGVKYIGDYAFANCKYLREISIPNSVQIIGDYLLKNCPKLEKITVGPKNKTYDSRNNCNAIIAKSGMVLISGCKNTTIPYGVRTINSGAFSGCSGLRSVKIPNSVRTLGWGAFSKTGITNISIPDSVTKIEEAAFMNCKELNFVKLPKNINKIDHETFANCTNLQNVVIPKSVKDIEFTAFCKQTYGANDTIDYAVLDRVSFWYYGSRNDWNSIEFTQLIEDSDEEDDGDYDDYDYEEEFGVGGFYSYYDTADKSWVNAYTSKVHFNYKEHEHKWNNKFSKQPTFKAEGIKSCSCSTCKMKFTNVPCNKLVSPTVSKLKAGKKQFTANWKKAPTVAGYQIQYATNAKFKKAKKVTVKKAGTIKKTFKKLKSRKKYYVRVRAYKTINGKKVYSPWSKSKTVKTK